MWLKHVSEQGPVEDPMRSEHPTKEGLVVKLFLLTTHVPLDHLLYRIILGLFAFAYMIHHYTHPGSFDRPLQP